MTKSRRQSSIVMTLILFSCSVLTGLPSPAEAQPGPGRACLEVLGDGMCWTQCSVFFDDLLCFEEAITRCCWDSPGACGDTSDCVDFCGGNCAGSGF